MGGGRAPPPPHDPLVVLDRRDLVVDLVEGPVASGLQPQRHADEPRLDQAIDARHVLILNGLGPEVDHEGEGQPTLEQLVGELDVAALPHLPRVFEARVDDVERRDVVLLVEVLHLVDHGLDRAPAPRATVVEVVVGGRAEGALRQAAPGGLDDQVLGRLQLHDLPRGPAQGVQLQDGRTQRVHDGFPRSRVPIGQALDSLEGGPGAEGLDQLHQGELALAAHAGVDTGRPLDQAHVLEAGCRTAQADVDVLQLLLDRVADLHDAPDRHGVDHEPDQQRVAAGQLLDEILGRVLGLDVVDPERVTSLLERRGQIADPDVLAGAVHLALQHAHEHHRPALCPSLRRFGEGVAPRTLRG